MTETEAFKAHPPTDRLIMELLVNSTGGEALTSLGSNLTTDLPSTGSVLNAVTQNISDNIQSVLSLTTSAIRDNLAVYSNAEQSGVSIVEPSPTPFATSDASGNSSAYVFQCKDGLFLPCWHSDGSTRDIFLHGVIYLLGLLYMFVGIAIIADRFMAAIEQITSQEQDVIVRRKDGTKDIVSVRIWNETVSNLTLMALGSSAPEIMLSVIEIYAQDFQAGELGPGTIVGSAAFNMFVIIAVCVWAVPTGTIKKIKYLRVFIVTLAFSVFAYVWMLVILVWITPGVIDIWEGLVTLLFFGITVGWAYIADRRMLIYKYLDKRLKISSKYREVPYTNGKPQISIEDGTDAEKVELNPIEKGDIGGTEKNVNGIVNPMANEVPDTMHKNLRVSLK